MKIKKVLNNGAVITTNRDGEEIVVLGKGLAFGKKPGDQIDESKIYKIFSPFDDKQRKTCYRLFMKPIQSFFKFHKKLSIG